MAQIVAVAPNIYDFPFPLTTPALLAGMQATILTGSGSIILSADLNAIDTEAATLNAYLHLYCDGQLIPGATLHVILPANQRIGMHITRVIKPGSGQHTFALYGSASAITTLISGNRAQLIIHEPGY